MECVAITRDYAATCAAAIKKRLGNLFAQKSFPKASVFEADSSQRWHSSIIFHEFVKQTAGQRHFFTNLYKPLPAFRFPAPEPKTLGQVPTPPSFSRLPDLPPVVAPTFTLEWGSIQARDGLPEGKRKSWIVVNSFHKRVTEHPGPEKGLSAQLDTSKALTFLLYSIIFCFIGPNPLRREKFFLREQFLFDR